MKKIILSFMFFSAILLAGSFVMESCGSKPSTDSEIKDVDDSEEIAYACPMHPEITGKKGDTCSKCGMNLEELEGEEGHEHEGDHDHEDEGDHDDHQ
jgi:hypothetical protein